MEHHSFRLVFQKSRKRLPRGHLGDQIVKVMIEDFLLDHTPAPDAVVLLDTLALSILVRSCLTP